MSKMSTIFISPRSVGNLPKWVPTTPRVHLKRSPARGSAISSPDPVPDRLKTAKSSGRPVPLGSLRAVRKISKNVKMNLAKKGLITDKMTKQEITKISKLANQSFPKATKNGIWGDPRKATKKDGIKILNEIVENLSKKCQTYLTEDRL